jgi:hypothetical protein
MTPSRKADALPSNLRTTYKLIESAFPQGIDEGAYLPLLALLGEQLSDRNLAEVVAAVFGLEYERVLNDVYRARSTSIPSPDAVQRVKDCLLPHGYECWLREP